MNLLTKTAGVATAGIATAAGSASRSPATETTRTARTARTTATRQFATFLVLSVAVLCLFFTQPGQTASSSLIGDDSPDNGEACLTFIELWNITGPNGGGYGAIEDDKKMRRFWDSNKCTCFAAYRNLHIEPFDTRNLGQITPENKFKWTSNDYNCDCIVGRYLYKVGYGGSPDASKYPEFEKKWRMANCNSTYPDHYPYIMMWDTSHNMMYYGETDIGAAKCYTGGKLDTIQANAIIHNISLKGYRICYFFNTNCEGNAVCTDGSTQTNGNSGSNPGATNTNMTFIRSFRIESRGQSS
ncbi:hypothetical protein GQ42DRAFT_49496 [Ramicandelaber brevisporus]|nr:hypothetical protein GQ42DRAFT_49496 [Ramicandelaber brevisporus]